ncbi:MAG TPA: hypothetical protein VGX50_21865 [Longimicrobium sp.]|nr:hypothetical protein [Longimicrobium sp.]
MIDGGIAEARAAVRAAAAQARDGWMLPGGVYSLDESTTACTLPTCTIRP